MKRLLSQKHLFYLFGKCLRIMRISIFLLIVGIKMTAAPAYSQNAVLTLEIRNKTLKDVFREIESQSEYIFFCNEEAVNLNKCVDISVEKGTITQILDEILDENAKYEIDERQVLIYKDKTAVNIPEAAAGISEVKGVNQEQITVNGQVTDHLGEPLSGANIVEKGTTNGVVADIDGNYSIKVRSRSSVLIFSYIGQETQEKTVGNQSVLNVVLEPALSDLDEIVVVGYGMQRKSSITGSIAVVNADKMKDITSPSVANMLQGKVAGVVATPLSGQPGQGVTIRVRGLGTIRGNKDPLWVIDGVVGDAVAELNPNDIESISVLKDGSATALYGSRGANGVILVATKRATMGTSLIEASAKLGVSQLQRGNLEMMNGAEYYDYVVTAHRNAGILDQQHWLQPYLANRNTDWWDISTRNALTQNYNIGYRYGNDRIRSYISADYYNEDGTIKGFEYDRFTLRVNTDYVVNKRLTLKAKLSASHRETDNQEHSLSYTSYTPWDTPYNSQGKLKDGSQGMPSADDAPTADPRDYWYSDGGTNFLYDRHLNWSGNRNNAMDLGLGFDYKILDYLTFESNNRAGFGNSYTETYTDPYSRGGQAKNGTIYNRSYNTRAIYSNQMLRLLKMFGEKHEINAFLGYEYDERRVWDSTGESSNMIPGNEVLSGGASDPVVTGAKTEEKNAACIFNGNYAFDDKYLFQASVRRDGSSRFGANKRWANFWSLGAGWKVHEEEFMTPYDFINELKPRVSYGITGNQPSGAYEWTTKLSSTMEYGNEVALYSNYQGNPDLSWEETASFDFGLDLRLFNRVNITFDTYLKKVKNLLYLRHLPAVTGYNRQTANDGKLENKGFEITITPEIIKTKDWYWDVSFNFGYNKNKITYLPDADDLAFQSVAVGYPYLNFYMREWAGVDPMTGGPLWFIVDEETGEKTATDDYNKATRVLLDASPSPEFNGGINTSLTWKNLSFNAVFTYSAGAKIYNGRRAGALDRDCERWSQPAMKLADGWSRWEKPGDIATHPKLMAGGNNGASNESTRYLENGDYFKMKTLSFAYRLPKKWLTPLGVSDFNITVGGENMFTITKYSGDDPEILLSDRFNGTTSASSGQLYPTVRRFTLGLNLKF
ncbi:MAG: TonB-dependent receptor [Tannerella sp.]|nr:TonB-dependent receptor [Tannerella sp.]